MQHFAPILIYNHLNYWYLMNLDKTWHKNISHFHFMRLEKVVVRPDLPKMLKNSILKREEATIRILYIVFRIFYRDLSKVRTYGFSSSTIETCTIEVVLWPKNGMRLLCVSKRENENLKIFLGILY